MNDPNVIFGGAPRGIVSFTGGGGKTSLMFHLAHHLESTGRKVLTTTSTKIFRPTPDQSRTVLIDPEPARIVSQAAGLLQTERHLTAAAAHLAEGDKLKGFAPQAIEAFVASGLFDWILVEADGSARRPLKAPAEHEPVIPPATTLLIAVAGLEVIGRPLTEDLVFRCELAGPRMGLAPEAVITRAALARLAAHPEGFFKNAPSGAKRLIFLNKADTSRRIENGAAIAGLLRQTLSPPADLLLVGQALEGIVIHAVHPLTETL